jgi:hypothetical protein
MIFRDSSGELALAARWTKCSVCGSPSPQPPVCDDLMCEIEYDRRSDASSGLIE